MANEPEVKPVVNSDVEAKLQAAEKAKAEIAADRDNLKKQYKATQEQLTAFAAKEAEREAVATKAAEEQQKKDLEAKGEYTKALKNLEDKYAKEKKEISDGVYNFVRGTVLPNTIKSLVVETGLNITPEALKDLPGMLKDRLNYDVTTGAMQVLDEKGQIMKDDKLNPISADVFLAQFVKDRPYLLKDTMAKTTGLTTADGGTQPIKPMTLAEIQHNPRAAKAYKEADPDGYAANIIGALPKSIADMMAMARAAKKAKQ
jgi:hypothetical protein